ncbi:hypothetical protein [Streptococcus dysgalactiae]|uniref:hypothetical protein n=1 Tax=Streptococcus dysgalactiae TaxID=1334 RepID=UPI0013FD2E78|nr:hypothetical protein [Streptococcus dysgalactiae]
MRNSNDSGNSGGISFSSLLTLLFIGLKLTGYLDWSWWWVLSPVWGMLAVVFLFYFFAWLWLKIKYWSYRRKK